VFEELVSDLSPRRVLLQGRKAKNVIRLSRRWNATSGGEIRRCHEIHNYTEGALMVALFELGARRAADAVRNGEQTAEALAEALLARCAAASPRRASRAAVRGAARAQGQHRYG
jgi:hypothetical protein